MSRTDLCAAAVAKSCEYKLEREGCSQKGRLRSGGTKLSSSCHPIIFSTRRKMEEKPCFESMRGASELHSPPGKMFLNGICGLLGHPLIIRPFLWDFVPSYSGGLF